MLNNYSVQLAYIFCLIFSAALYRNRDPVIWKNSVFVAVPKNLKCLTNYRAVTPAALVMKSFSKREPLGSVSLQVWQRDEHKPVTLEGCKEIGANTFFCGGRLIVFSLGMHNIFFYKPVQIADNVLLQVIVECSPESLF